MIKGVVKTINVTSSDLELIDFMLSNNEKAAKKMPECDTKAHMDMLHSDLRKVLKEAK
jgi:hypothetical protein